MKLRHFRLIAPVIGLLGLAPIAFAQQNSAPAPKEFKKLLKVDPRGGKVIRPKDFDLTKPGAKWAGGADRVYEQTYSDYGSYRIEAPKVTTKGPAPKLESGQQTKGMSLTAWSDDGMKVPETIKENRSYIVSVLVNADIDREHTELNVTLHPFSDGKRTSPRRTLGLPAKTKGPDGWQRLEWTIDTPTDSLIDEYHASIHMSFHYNDKPLDLRIADFAFVELPKKELKPIPRSEGMEFPGSAGDFDMKVLSAEQQDNHIIVKTTGAKYDFDTDKSTFMASQRVDFKRDLAEWESSLPLKNLRIDKQNDDVCILSNEHLTIGIQRDSLLLISSQSDDFKMTLTNLFGGDFNRYSRDNLYSTDDFGGISVDPYIPMGTGLKPQSELLTKNVSFADITPENNVKRYGSFWDAEKLGSAEPGWKARWTTRPGEYFATSVFPPRPFDWERSFEGGNKAIKYWQKLADYGHKDSNENIKYWRAWDLIPKTYGHSYSTRFKPHDEEHMHKVVATAHKLGIGVIPYMSAFFSQTRDPEEYIAGVKEFKEKYDIDGVYSDGIPSTDWLVAYKEMRMLRDLFPSGYIEVHDTTRQAGWTVSQNKPFIYTYATATYLAEGVPTNSGKDWIYPRYVTSQFRKANTFGDNKGSGWKDADDKQLPGDTRTAISLVYNGRKFHGTGSKQYRKHITELQDLWKEKGSDPFFYDRYFLPKSQELTELKLGRTAMPIADRNGNNISLKSMSPDAKIYYTTDGSTPTKDSTRYKSTFTADEDAVIKAIAVAPDLDPSAVAILGRI